MVILDTTLRDLLERVPLEKSVMDNSPIAQEEEDESMRIELQGLFKSLLPNEQIECRVLNRIFWSVALVVYDENHIMQSTNCNYQPSSSRKYTTQILLRGNYLLDDDDDGSEEGEEDSVRDDLYYRLHVPTPRRQHQRRLVPESGDRQFLGDPSPD